ncbi:hypothetical protein OTU49_000381, partial [Cherax quadricarinatus]
LCFSTLPLFFPLFSFFFLPPFFPPVPLLYTPFSSYIDSPLSFEISLSLSYATPASLLQFFLLLQNFSISSQFLSSSLMRPFHLFGNSLLSIMTLPSLLQFLALSCDPSLSFVVTPPSIPLPPPLFRLLFFLFYCNSSSSTATSLQLFHDQLNKTLNKLTVSQIFLD